MLKSCQRWCPEIFANVHADTVYRWKWDGPGSGEKLTILTHDLLRHGSCVALKIMRALSPRPLQEGRFEGEVVA